MYASEQLGVPAALFCVRDGSRSFAMPEALLLGKAGITSYEVIRSDNINMSDPLRSDSLHLVAPNGIERPPVDGQCSFSCVDQLREDQTDLRG